MSIATAITAAQTKVANAYTAVNSKGGTLPATQNLTNLPTAISSIPSGGGSQTKYGANVDTFLGDVNSNGVLQYPSGNVDLIFTGVKKIGESLYTGANLAYKFYYNKAIRSASFPDLEEIVVTSGMYYCFFQSSLSAVSFPKLKKVTANSAMAYALANTNVKEVNFESLEEISGSSAFSNCMQGYSVYSLSQLEKCYFPKLSNIGNASYLFSSCFSQQAKLTDVYFNALTTSSFGSYTNQLQNMFNANTGISTAAGCTVHFPSNMETTISGLTGYPLFGGKSGYVVLSYDLPATS